MGLVRGEKNPVTYLASKRCFLYSKPSQTFPNSPTAPGAVLVQVEHGRVQNLPGHLWAGAVGKMGDAIRMLLAPPQALENLVF